MPKLETPQEIFTAVKNHLLKQNQVSGILKEFDSNDPYFECYYRLKKNGRILKCAAGALIQKKHYNYSFERRSLLSEEARSALAKSGVLMNTENINLLSDLQRIHDTKKPEEWPTHLAHLAKNHGLDF